MYFMLRYYVDSEGVTTVFFLGKPCTQHVHGREVLEGLSTPSDTDSRYLDIALIIKLNYLQREVSQ